MTSNAAGTKYSRTSVVVTVYLAVLATTLFIDSSRAHCYPPVENCTTPYDALALPANASEHDVYCRQYNETAQCIGGLNCSHSISATIIGRLKGSAYLCQADVKADFLANRACILNANATHYEHCQTTSATTSDTCSNTKGFLSCMLTNTRTPCNDTGALVLLTILYRQNQPTLNATNCLLDEAQLQCDTHFANNCTTTAAPTTAAAAAVQATTNSATKTVIRTGTTTAVLRGVATVVLAVVCSTLIGCGDL